MLASSLTLDSSYFERYPDLSFSNLSTNTNYLSSDIHRSDLKRLEKTLTPFDKL
jgi:hypothetical protein